MAKLDHQTIRTSLIPYLQPGEDIVHAAYGVRPPGVLAIMLLAVLTLGVGTPLAVHFLTKRYLVGVTRSRLILVRTKGFGLQPGVGTSVPLGALAGARTDAGLIFVRIDLPPGVIPDHLKFHRAAFSGNREEAVAVGHALIAGPAAYAPGYPAGMLGVGPVAVPAVASAESHVALGLAVAGAAVMLRVSTTLYYTLVSDFPLFDVLTSDWGLLSLRGVFLLAVGGVAAGGTAFACSRLMATSSATARGALAGGFAYLGDRILRDAAHVVLSGNGNPIFGVLHTLRDAFTELSAVGFLVWSLHIALGVVVARAMGSPKAMARTALVAGS